jgi:WD40 repeat protein
VIAARPETKCVFSSDGTRVATYVINGPTIETWNRGGQRGADARAALTLKGQSSNIIAAAFSPDAQSFVTASGDRMARIWRLDGDGSPVLLRGHNDSVYGASFNPDGTWVLTNSDDGTARIWHADGRDEPLVLRLPANQKRVMNAAFSPDGGRVLTRTYNPSLRPNDVRVFRVSVPALLAYLRESTTACLTPQLRVRALGESDADAKSHFEACETAKIKR